MKKNANDHFHPHVSGSVAVRLTITANLLDCFVSVIPAYYTKEYREQNSNLPEINTRLTLTTSESLLETGR